MTRRALVALLLAVVTRPLAVGAQQTPPVIGFLNSGSPGAFGTYLDGFRRGLRDAGYVEGQNVTIEFRWAEGQYSQLPALAADLVNRKVDVITATGGAITATAAKAATRMIPIVFHVGPDPVAAGLVASLNRPGGNVTGIALLTAAAWTKRLELAAAVADKNAPIGVLLNPDYKASDPTMDDMQNAAQALGRRLAPAFATSAAEFEKGLESLDKAKVGAVLISTDPFFLSEREKLGALAARLRLPTICGWAEEAKAGCLISYGSDQRETYYQAGFYTGRVLKGEKPADLPVLQATRLVMAVNLKTAKALGLTIPPELLARADEVIE